MQDNVWIQMFVCLQVGGVHAHTFSARGGEH